MKRLRISLLSTFLLLTACHGHLPLLYRVDVAQGNVYPQSAVNQLQRGMTRTQVHRILGTPVLNDPFRNNQDYYVYRFTSGHTDVTYRKDLNITYDQNNQVIDIQESKLTTEEK